MTVSDLGSVAARDQGDSGDGREAGKQTRSRCNCQCHCTACNGCYSGVAAFDAHRSGPPDARVCLDPADVKRLQVKTESGQCELGWPGEVRAVTLWQVVPGGLAA